MHTGFQVSCPNDAQPAVLFLLLLECFCIQWWIALSRLSAPFYSIFWLTHYVICLDKSNYGQPNVHVQLSMENKR